MVDSSVTIGVIPNLMFTSFSELKKFYLFFDVLATKDLYSEVPIYDGDKGIQNQEMNAMIEMKKIVDVWDFVESSDLSEDRKNGLRVFESALQKKFIALNQARMPPSSPEDLIRNADNPAYWKKLLAGMHSTIDDLSRISAVILNQIEYVDSVPMIAPDNIYQEDGLTKKSNIVRIVLKKFPVITPDCSLDRIEKFKSDKRHHEMNLRLKVWIDTINKSDFDPKIFIKQYDQFLHAYTNALDEYKCNYKNMTFTRIITLTAEAILSIAKLDISKISEVWLEATKGYMDLSDIELKAPGREVAYLYELTKEFS